MGKSNAKTLASVRMCRWKTCSNAFRRKLKKTENVDENRRVFNASRNYEIVSNDV